MSNETIDEALAHYGVKGMRWGVRKDRPQSAGAARRASLKGLGTSDEIVRTTAAGDTVTMRKNPPNAVTKALATLSEKYTNNYNDGAFFTFKDANGKKIGEANLWKKNDDELYLNWIGIKPSARGRGYATAALKSAEEYGSKNGFKKMTLEVPGNAPDARHIYEKLGFKVLKEVVDPNEPVWGGLTSMEYTFSKSNAKVKHTDSPMDYVWFLDGIDKYIQAALTEEVKHVNENIDEALAHYGVKGMRWGVRRSDKALARSGGGDKVRVKKVPGKGVEVVSGGKNQSVSDDAVKAAIAKTKASKSSTDSLSNVELKALVDRMNLEQQYSKLTDKEKQSGHNSTFAGKAVKKGAKFAAEVIVNVAKTQATAVGNQKVAAMLQAKGVLNDPSKKK